LLGVLFIRVLIGNLGHNSTIEKITSLCF